MRGAPASCYIPNDRADSASGSNVPTGLVLHAHPTDKIAFYFKPATRLAMYVHRSASKQCWRKICDESP